MKSIGEKENPSDVYIGNMLILRRVGPPFGFCNNGECVVIRPDQSLHPGKPKVDFFPSTGRWRANNKTFSGGANAMITWYHNQ